MLARKMMLRFLAVVFFVSIAFTAIGFAEDKPTKIGYVDLSRLFDEYSKTKDYDKQLESKQKDFETERNKRAEKVQESMGKLGVLAEDKKKAAEAEIEKMKNDLIDYDKQQKTDLTKERNEKIREILLEIEKIVSDYAEKDGYTLILNDRVLIYGQPTSNLTEKILEKLNGPVTDKKAADPKATQK